MPLTLTREMVTEQQTKWVYPRPITFDEWLEVCGPKDWMELVDGVLVEKTMVQLEHEKLQSWLYAVLIPFVQERDLGIVLGSRSPVQINEFRGRMPDLFFVRKDRLDIVGQKATREAPDLVIEIVSPGDRPSDVRALETDYRSIGVEEIVFIDQRRNRVRVLRRSEQGYEADDLTSGGLTLRALDGLSLEWDWLFIEPRPAVMATVTRLLGR
jgi:Uma2 family endonuclease